MPCILEGFPISNGMNLITNCHENSKSKTGKRSDRGYNGSY